MTRRLLELGPLPPGLQQKLAARHVVHPLWKERDPKAFLSAQRGSFDGAVTMSRHGAKAEVFECLGPRVVACFGVGFENIDLAAADHHGTQVSTTPDVLTECVADTAFGLILATARQLVAADRFVRAGHWTEALFGLGRRVHGMKLGIVGLGRIGSAVARRAAGFGMPVRYTGRQPKPQEQAVFEPDLLRLAEWSDVLVLAVPGGEGTHHLVDATVLRALGPRGFLVNVARGSVVNELALVEALRNNAIAGAGLDVFEREPQVPEALRRDERVVLLPHISASTQETRHEMEQLVMDNLAAFFETGQVLTPPRRTP